LVLYVRCFGQEIFNNDLTRTFYEDSIPWINVEGFSSKMREKRRMYIGTDTGLSLLTGLAEDWQYERNVLDGKFVRAITSVSGASTAYACVTKDGLYATWDGGLSWELALRGNVHSVAVDPTNPKVVYSGVEPVGLFRAEDAGRGWTEVQG